MLNAVQQFFEKHIAGAVRRPAAAGAERGYRLATAALLIEMMRADHEVKPGERDAVLLALQRAFSLTGEETEKLVQLAETEARESTSLYDFTRLINDHFTAEQKEHLVELMWHVAFADGEIDKYEEHLVRKVADLIHVPHSGFIRSKHRAQAQRDGG